MKAHNAGFTLVELAVVLICIGIVTAGVIKGHAMIRDARITSTIAQMQSYKKGYDIFINTYRFRPGDMPAAQSALPNCTAATYCLNGNGNEQVGLLTGANAPILGNAVIQSETVQFWKHLALAGLISGINENVDWQTPSWGQTHPKSPIAGGVRIFL